MHDAVRELDREVGDPWLAACDGSSVAHEDPDWRQVADDVDALPDWVLREAFEAWDRELGLLREPWQYTEEQLLGEVNRLGADIDALTGRRLRLLAEVERREACGAVAGMTTVAWLVDGRTVSPRAARTLVRLAHELEASPTVSEALASARVSVEQASTITAGLTRLPSDLTLATVHAVAETLVGYADEFGPAALRRLVNRAVETVAPEVAEAVDAAVVARMEREQARTRYLTWWRDDDGGLGFSGKLSSVPGEQLVSLVTALSTGRRHADAIAGEQPTLSQACADALADIVAHYASCGHGRCGLAPRAGGERPRVIVTIAYDALLANLGGASLLGPGEPLTPAQARRLACDAGILPAVLGGDSQPLDVGREQRLFAGPLRQAILLRDGGCAFPGCDRRPGDCEIHHIVPWWQGGHTRLGNGVALCAHHHHLVEPDPNAPPGSRWEVTLDPHGLPAFLAPLRRGATVRMTRQHHRYRTRR